MRRRPRSDSRNPVWIFDLDNTLHDAGPHIFPHLSATMTAYLEQHVGVAAEDAPRLRTHYWRRYGATLLGLMRHHDVEPSHFLWETHQFPDLPRMVHRHPLLRSVLTRLPGRKLVFSNAPAHYSRAVLDLLRVADLFDTVFSIEHTKFQPKPDRRGFLRLLHKHRLLPGHCIMVEDSLVNLRTAKRLGMRTVWVTRSHKRPAYVDITISHVARLPAALSQVACHGC
ncbi:MAG: pyrimidine 5'-nucleotidase [Betaproteobacteria bacterium]